MAKDSRARMYIARTTVTAIHDSAIADVLVHGKRLSQAAVAGSKLVETHQEFMEKGSRTMRIAVTYETERFFSILVIPSSSLYDVEENRPGQRAIDKRKRPRW